MNDKRSELLDPAETNDLSEREKQVVKDAQNAGNSPKSAGAAGDTTGMNKSRKRGVASTAARLGDLNKTVIPGAMGAIESDAPGDDSDISGGIANLNNTTDAPVEQNPYNR